MHYVYILISSKFDTRYTGQTDDLRRRLVEHNAGKCFHTRKYMPWKLRWYCSFSQKKDAILFEKYLKTGSGIAFMNKHFLG